MNLHLAEIATEVGPGRHAVLILDQAGWHLSHRLIVPANITLLPLPPKCPELNPVENLWQFMRENWLSNRVFTSYDKLDGPLLLCLEHPRQPAMAHHVHRTARLGASVLISGTWYYAPARRRRIFPALSLFALDIGREGSIAVVVNTGA